MRSSCSCPPASEVAVNMPTTVATMSSGRTSSRSVPAAMPASRIVWHGGGELLAGLGHGHGARGEYRPERVRHLPLGRDIVGEPVHPRAQRAVGRVGRQQVVDAGAQVGEFLAVERLDQRLAGREVPVEGADADPGSRAICSSVTGSRPEANAARAASSSRARLRSASARGRRGGLRARHNTEDPPFICYDGITGGSSGSLSLCHVRRISDDDSRPANGVPAPAARPGRHRAAGRAHRRPDRVRRNAAGAPGRGRGTRRWPCCARRPRQASTTSTPPTSTARSTP